MTSRTQIFLQFYDQILAEIVHGDTSQAIGRLVGMFDGLALQHHGLELARRTLRGHELHRLLPEAPQHPSVYRPAAHPDRSADATSSTAQRVAEATGNIAIERAFRQRRQFVEHRVARASAAGLAICLFGDQKVEQPWPVDPRGHANVTIADGQAADLAAFAADRGRCFDVVCAPYAPDSCDTDMLGQLLSAMHSLLSPDGTALISALLPNHIGAGWARICLNWRPRVHAEGDLRRLATGAGFTAHSFHDETDCIVWCVLRHARADDDRGIGNAHI